jgi:hypothetical protein
MVELSPIFVVIQASTTREFSAVVLQPKKAPT